MFWFPPRLIQVWKGIYTCNAIPISLPADSLPENFDRSCEEQKERFDYIQCTEDGNFSPIQCLNNYCFCVNIENGIRLNDKEFKEGVLTEKKCLKGIYYMYIYIYIQ